MWYKANQLDAFIITITPRTITYSHLTRPAKTSRIQLLSHNAESIDRLQLEKLILFNPTSIGNQLAQQYRTITNQSVPILIALNGPSIFTKIVSSSKAYPTLKQLNLPQKEHMKWVYRYLYSREPHHYFYVCGIPQQLILQYQLMSIAMQLPLRLISSEQMALLTLYRHIAGSAFRHSKLGAALTEKNNNIEQLFSPNDLDHLFSKASHQGTDSNLIPLLTACGLFISEGWQ